MNKARIFKKKVFFLLFILTAVRSEAQSLLNKPVSLEVKNQPVSSVLSAISQQGNFYFSYNSSLIREDSLVSLSVKSKTVKQVLDMLFSGRLRYKETGNYVILQTAFSVQSYTVSGYIMDGRTGEKISDATIYEPQQFVSAFSDEEGFFQLTLKDKKGSATIRVSKISYLDTGFTIMPGYDQELNIIINSTPLELDPVIVYNKVEKTWLAKVFLSSRQRVQSLNLSKFFADKPFQFSLTPGLGTHGLMGAQVINKFSLNILGGYTAGVNGVEIGGLFNIVKKDVYKLQIAGIFNVVGGKMKGVQLGGIHNKVLDSVIGLQVAGFNNNVNGPLTGVQLGGIYNKVNSNVSGLQIAGAMNVAGGNTEGVQLSGLYNVTRREAKGIQISSVFNYTKKLSGVQLALINIADTSEGYGIGLINISGSYHKLSVYSSELAAINVAFKSGNKRLYSIINAGYRPDIHHKLFYFGFGFGREIPLSDQFSVSPEALWQYVYTGSWKDLNDMIRVNLDVRYRLNKWITLFAGPSVSAYMPHQDYAIKDYQFPVPADHYSRFALWGQTRGWIGWHAGINLF